MIVPRSKNPKASTPQGDQPSEAMLLMALAHMKKIGRIPDKEAEQSTPPEAPDPKAALGGRPKPKLVSSQPLPSDQDNG